MSYRCRISAGTFAALGALILVGDACGGAAEPFPSDPSTVLPSPASSSAVATTRAASSVRTQFDFGLSPASYAGSDLPDFLDLLDSQTAALDVRPMVWSVVHVDLVSQQPFRAMDLVRPDGTERPSWQRWLDLRR